MADTRTYKVGTNRGKPRIWLDGKPLVEAGFIGGSHYHTAVGFGFIHCELEGSNPHDTEHTDWKRRKVTGRPNGKPLIDMNGRDVETAFPGAKTVRVTFSRGLIKIERGE